jgi:ABC-type transport system substrate-binding protein
MGIDRQRIIDNFYPEGSEAATHFTPCAIPLGCEGDEWYEFDPEAARALLAEAGLPNGFTTVLNYRDVVRGYLPDPNVVAQDLQAQLRDNLGIISSAPEIEELAKGGTASPAKRSESGTLIRRQQVQSCS